MHLNWNTFFFAAFLISIEPYFTVNPATCSHHFSTLERLGDRGFNYLYLDALGVFCRAIVRTKHTFSIRCLKRILTGTSPSRVGVMRTNARGAQGNPHRCNDSTSCRACFTHVVRESRVDVTEKCRQMYSAWAFNEGVPAARTRLSRPSKGCEESTTNDVRTFSGKAYSAE